MFSKISIFRTLSVLIVIVLMSSTASARPLDAPLGTGFTYQGKLTDGGAPANGTYDFEFKLYDALSGGSPVGSTVTLGDVPVTNGLFTVQLDFGDVFDGTPLFLEVSVRGLVAGSYVFIPLIPRQALTPTPYAIYAEKAPWSGLTGVPAGFADGVDNGSSYQYVKVVAKSGGDFTSIQAALDSITASTSNRYLVWVAPGVYSEQVTMKPFVDIEGAGELTTRITFTGSAGPFTGTLLGANNTELRFLTVENTGGNTYATAIYNSSAAPRLTHVTASASGGSNSFGVLNYPSSSPTMTDVTASASGGTSWNYGVYNSVSSSPTMTSVTASASGGEGNYGVYNSSSSSPTMTGVTASASGGTSNYGVYNSSSSSPTMTSVTASASGGTSINYGVYNYFSSPTINNSLISASGGTNNCGIYNYAGSGSYTVRVNNSQVSGDNNTIQNYGFITRVGASQLSGGAVVVSSGTVSCIGVYDENYASLGYTICP